MSLQFSLFSPPSKIVPRPKRIEYVDPFYASNKPLLDAAGPNPLMFDEEIWDRNGRGGAVGLDIEIYSNFFLACFKRFSDGTRVAFERSFRSELDRDFILSILHNNTIITFNGATYDLPLLYLALAGAGNASLKIASDKVIFGNVKPWDIQKLLGIRVPQLNHIDLMEPNPSIRQGLKMLNGRLHGRYMVDLPFDPEDALTPEQMNVTTLYCFNDLETTQTVYKALREPLELRAALGKIHGIDFRSKSDSQIGETIVKRQVEAALGGRIEKAALDQTSFKYDIPDFVTFQSYTLNKILDQLRDATFYINSMGKPVTPKFLEKLQIPIGGMKYSMGIGGLHSTESHRGLRSDDKYFLLDVDVASQYPNIIMKLGLYPKAMGPAFLDVYGELIKTRLAAKDAYKISGNENDRVRADGGRIALNGVYGKLGSPYSPLYSPNLLIATTLTGQLAILMLIERAEIGGIRVVSANTDGVVFQCRRSSEDSLTAILDIWQSSTGFTIEKTPYAALYNSSVNTYIAIKEDGKIKSKGYIANPWKEGDLRGQMMKNPSMTICSEAIMRHLVDGIPIDQTIEEGQDPRDFVTVVKVSTGGIWRGHKLGRAVRYYWSLDGDQIFYSDGSRRVSKTEGARPMLELTQTIPEDVDRLRYFEEATKLAADLGIAGF